MQKLKIFFFYYKEEVINELIPIVESYLNESLEAFQLKI